MKLIFLLIVIFIGYILAFKNSKIVRRTDTIFKLNKKNFYTWMNFSKKERYELSKKSSLAYLNQRKNLLKKIRNEYKDISSAKDSSD